jgi:hypothetical protein
MIKNATLFLAAALSFATVAPVLADEGDVDIRSFEYLDVLETNDGSVWKGVIVEQTPNVSYKIAIAGGSVHVIKAEHVVKMSKQRNRDFGNAMSPRPMHNAAPMGNGMGGVGATYEPRGSGLPKPMARTGARFEPEVGILFPSGDVSMYETTFSPSIRGGYEALFGNFGIGGGGLARFNYWMLPGDTKDAHWTLETHLYGRLAMHISRVTAFAGLSLGIDTNYVYAHNIEMSKTSLGFGMNLQTGIELAATDLLALRFGFDYHPGTDKIVEGADASISYYGLLLGANLRL